MRERKQMYVTTKIYVIFMKILNPKSYLTIQITSTFNFRQYALWINSDQDNFEL